MKPYFNKQRIFDQVVRALRAQDRPSINGCRLPMYRNRDGSRCAMFITEYHRLLSEKISFRNR
jgi:hypothetical protein